MGDYLTEEQFNAFIESLKARFLDRCKRFHDKEGRDLIYILSRHFLDRSKFKELYKVAAIEIILMIWNMAWYQKLKKEKKEELEQNIIELIKEYDKDIPQIRSKNIFSLNDNDKIKIINLFGKFRTKLGPVGAAKTLHILKPELFPIWDRKVTLNYHKYYHKGKHRGSSQNGECYFQFCLDSREILLKFNEHEREELLRIHNGGLRVLKDFPDFRETLLKMLDECNYEAITEKLR